MTCRPLAPLLLLAACGTQAPTTPAPAPAPVVPEPAPEPAEAPQTPFVSDTVSVEDMTAAGWTCVRNEIENLDCGRALDVDGVGAARISVMPTEAGQVSLINLTASSADLTAASSALLGSALADLASEHGWSCGTATETGARSCTKDGATIQIETFPNEGFAMASVRDPSLDGQLAD